MDLARFIHSLGMCLWIGGAIAAALIAMGVAGERGEVRAPVYRVLARIHTSVIGLGALLVLASGVLLMMNYSGTGLEVMMREPSRWVMVVVGLVACLLVLFLALPTAVRVGGLAVSSEAGEMPPIFEVYRKRLAIVSNVAAALAVVSLFAWVVL